MRLAVYGFVLTVAVGAVVGGTISALAYGGLVAWATTLGRR